MGLATPARLTPGAVLATASGSPVTVQSWRGEGSYAHVFRALLHPNARACAFKLPKSEVPEAVERLEREAAVLARLRDPHVVGLVDRGEWSGRPFLLLEWLDGETLRERLSPRRRLPLRQALDLLSDLLRALDHIHGLGAVHGDVREQNVIVVGSRGAVLTDPGAEGDAAADLRAAGAIFYRMLTGEPLSPAPAPSFPGGGHNPGAVRLWELSQQPAPPTAAALLQHARKLRARL